MEYLNFVVGGAALAAVVLSHWFLAGRLPAMSGRYSTLIDRLRGKKRTDDDFDLSPEELLEAMKELTMEEFGQDAMDAMDAEGAPDASSGGAVAATATLTAPEAPSLGLIYMGGMVAGGFLSALMVGAVTPTMTLNGVRFHELFGSGMTSVIPLVVGGFFVGIGTRMAGGCTTGHGLCGMGALQLGSLVTTMSFFGVGIATALLLGVVL